MSRLSEIRVGHTYHWDVKGTLSLHKGTKTVTVLAIEDRGALSTPLARVESIQTGERFATDVHWLQLPPELLRRKFLSLRKWYKRHKPKMLFTREERHFWPKSTHNYKQYVIIDICRGINKVRALDAKGIVHTFDMAWTKLNVPRNSEYVREMEAEYEEMMKDTEPFEDDDWDGDSSYGDEAVAR